MAVLATVAKEGEAVWFSPVRPASVFRMDCTRGCDGERAHLQSREVYGGKCDGCREAHYTMPGTHARGQQEQLPPRAHRSEVGAINHETVTTEVLCANHKLSPLDLTRY